MCLVLWCTHTKKVGVPYIYRGIAYDSRRGRGIARVQWGGHLPAHERTTHNKRQAVQASPHVFKTASTTAYSFPSSFCSDDSYQHHTQGSSVYFLIKQKIFYKYLLTLFLVHI